MTPHHIVVVQQRHVVDFVEQVKLGLVQSWVRVKEAKEDWRGILLEKMMETPKEMVMGRMMETVIKTASLRVPLMVIVEIRMVAIKTEKAMLQSHFDLLYDDCCFWVDLEDLPPAAASGELYC